MADPLQSGAETPRFLKYPYSVSGSGIPNTTTADDHLRELILQVLFTSPGERVNLPEFGVGVQRLVFEPSDDTLRSSAQFLISTNLQRWLGDRINVEQVNVTGDPGDESTVRIEITYTAIATQRRESVTVQV
jgi:phage baseplate assembly protein W